MEKNRTIDYYRKQRIKHINRKKRIIHELDDYWSYKYDGMLSKGKILCSCFICSGKSAVHGPTIRDIRIKEGLDQQLLDLQEEYNLDEAG